MRRFSPEEKNDQNFRKLLQQISTEPNTIRHTCTKCRLGAPSMECTDCFALLCQGCVRFYGHDPGHKMIFHHPENLPQNAIPGQPMNTIPPDLDLAGLTSGGAQERRWAEGLGDQVQRKRYDSMQSESDTDSENNAYNLQSSINRNYKALKTDATAKALFEKSIRVCHDCSFAIFSVDQGKAHDFHQHVTHPDEAGEAIKAIFRKYETTGPIFVQRGEEAQHLCIVEKDKLQRSTQLSTTNVANAYSEAIRVLSDFKSEFTKSLTVAVDERAAEIDLIDSLLYRQLRLEDFYDDILCRIKELGLSNPAAAINLWRYYCSEVRQSEWRRRGARARMGGKSLSGKPAPGGIYFSQAAEYIDAVNSALNHVKVAYDSLIGAVSRAITDHIDRTIMKPEKIMAKLKDEYAFAEDLISLRDAQKLQCLSGLPLSVRHASGISEPIPYARNIGPMNLCAFFYMMDTFHTKWTKVMAAIHDTRWLAIYVPDNPSVIEGDDPVRGFRAGEFAEIVEESQKPLYKSPPECIINLAEIQVNTIRARGTAKDEPGQLISPIGKLLSEVLNLPGLEVLRIIKGSVHGWWTFVHPEAKLIAEWSDALKRWGPREPGRESSWPSKSSTYVPSTNPGTSAASLGINLPPIGRRWGAIHVREAPRNWERPKGGSEENKSTDSLPKQIK